MKLQREQQNKLLEWAAEGLRLPEINTRAAEFDPPFAVEWLQLKHARKRAKKRFADLREDLEKEALARGLARKLGQDRIYLEICLTPEMHSEVEVALAEEAQGVDLSQLINRLLADWLKWRHV